MLQSPFPLKSTLGRTHRVDLEDTRRAKEALLRLGYFKPPRWGLTQYPDEPLFGAIEDFQRDNDLYRDGVMHPNGETATRLGQALADLERRQGEPTHSKGFIEGEWDWRDKPRGRAAQILSGPRVFGIGAEIGEGRRNDPEDLLRLERGLDWAGYRPTSDSLTEAIKRFQADHGLEVDGWVRPGGPTARMLDETIAPKILAWRERHPEEEPSSLGNDEQVAQVPQAVQGILRAAPLIGAAGEAMRQQIERMWSNDSADPQSAGATSSHREITDPPPSVPPSEPDGEKPDYKEEILPTSLKPIDLSQPIPENLDSGIYIHPLPDEELIKLGQITESRGNPKTQAQLDDTLDQFLSRNPGWTHGGGAHDIKSGKEIPETHLAGPLGGELGGKLAGKGRTRGDGRPGGRRADLTLISPSGRTVVYIQTVTVDKNGKPIPYEIDAGIGVFKNALAIEAAKENPRRVCVMLVPKQTDLDRIFGRKR